MSGLHLGIGEDLVYINLLKFVYIIAYLSIYLLGSAHLYNLSEAYRLRFRMLAPY